MDEQEQREREAAKKELLEGDIGELATGYLREWPGYLKAGGRVRACRAGSPEYG